MQPEDNTVRQVQGRSCGLWHHFPGNQTAQGMRRTALLQLLHATRIHAAALSKNLASSDARFVHADPAA